MPGRLSVDVDLGKFEDQLDEGVRAILLATTRTGNKLIERAKTSGLREIDRIYGIGPRAFEKYVEVRLATEGEFEVSIRVTGKQLPLYHFDPRPTKKGVSVKIKGRRVLIPHAFMARMRSGHVGVFARGAYGGKGVRGERLSGEAFGRFKFARGSQRVRGLRPKGKGSRRSGLPVNELYTFTPSEALTNEQVEDAMFKRVQDDLPKVMRQELNFALRRL